jgi:hypothetical protein
VQEYSLHQSRIAEVENVLLLFARFFFVRPDVNLWANVKRSINQIEGKEVMALSESIPWHRPKTKSEFENGVCASPFRSAIGAVLDYLEKVDP